MDVVIPALGESVTEATIGQWLKKAGDQVKADEPIVSLETDKVAVEVPAPADGVLTELKFQEGDTVTVGAVIATLEAGAAGAPKPTTAPISPAVPAAAHSPDGEAGPATGEPGKPTPEVVPAAANSAGAPAQGAAAPAYEAIAPAVRVLVETYNLDPASVTGTGKDGRLTKGDVLAAIEAGTAKVKGAALAVASSGAPARAEERVRMTRLRQTIARRLKEAQNTAALLTTFNDVDMTAVMDARNRYKEAFEKKHGVRLGFMSFFVKACALAARDVPSVNARIEGDEIVFHDYLDVGVAVSGPGGLVVPILKNADSKSFAEIELEIADFGKRARDNKLKLEEMQGGTFTISNGGVFGSLMSTPIINPPQSAVLGMHRIEERPVVVKGQIVARPMMYLALSYDHRLIDGREAVTYLVRVKEALEDPTRLVIDL
ncbi:2-oxoglutarate dehydrogenase complex dihydrolipoyllysine-residue succinyltransferase [Sandaracinobacter sp. RS1-74]|uniref:2-oxoglutarate dehydrogenase complex dihydrolipoyllysine-residue succinyltransferase n=1 Tax=Sandaracinobacteroides sayramensis TaxID=2913411 RepID=UPI001EDA0AF4|nr:2-oxoglutarate dehydrogenase complex dihydrolipoyllysine-residue succinyltransferase [Sandaracinobacteroides sayramensis]MCG2841571.1 2-oxoglutarate dehydrogenase complex dihydrolipoyllysine-residue succinyltransferase [Sandaracinobacteroides sayramensis]